MKKIILSMMVAMLIIGCGDGGSDDNNKDNSTLDSNGADELIDDNTVNQIRDINITNSIPEANASVDMPTDINNTTIDTPDIKTGHYFDSAVEGVDYSCGNQQGTTDSNGTFYFESGKECVFTLGNIVLRELNTTNLEDNVVILENNIDNARLLQTLDNDGDADNGIQITKNVLDAISQGDLDSAPASDDDLRAIFESAEGVEGFDGALVSIDEAKAHLQETIDSIKPYTDMLLTEDDANDLEEQIDSLTNGL